MVQYLCNNIFTYNRTNMNYYHYAKWIENCTYKNETMISRFMCKMYCCYERIFFIYFNSVKFNLIQWSLNSLFQSVSWILKLKNYFIHWVIKILLIEKFESSINAYFKLNH